MKWTKFKDSENIPLSHPLFITDWETVWIGRWDDYRDNLNWSWFRNAYPNNAWAMIPVVETPKEPTEFHICEMKDCICEETACGLYLITYTQMGRRILLNVKCCPFCGFTPK